MAQFDVYRVRGGGLVIDCQADVLRSLPTRFVVPLRARDDSAMDRHSAIFKVENREFAMVTQLAGGIDTRDLKTLVVSLVQQEYGIKSALDMLSAGY